MEHFWRRGHVSILVASVFLALGLTNPIAAATLEVDGNPPFPTIQSAIDTAGPFVDDVFVHCGVYQENIVMRNGVSVRGAGESCTVIDGGQNGSVVTMLNIGSSTVLEGFTITNGDGTGLCPDLITNTCGGGIYIEGGSPTVTRNVITGNTALGFGGGIHLQGPISELATEPKITRNVITFNSAGSWGGGIEVDVDAFPTISGNLLEENVAGSGGGAIDVFGNSFATLINNTIVRNCIGTCQSGGAVTFDGTSVGDLVNNVIAWNQSGAGGGLDVVDPQFFNLQSNDVYDNQPVNYFGIADPTGSDGNISVDPLFADEHAVRSGYQPRSDSPLVDAGSVAAPTLDLRGIPHSLDGDLDGIGAPDIGARENEGSTRLLFATKDSLGWDASGNPSALYNLYRGDFDVLVATGVYTQDPLTLPGAERWCDLASPAVDDFDLPDPEQVLFYVAVAEQVAEGSLGFDSTPTERPFTEANRCP